MLAAQHTNLHEFWLTDPDTGKQEHYKPGKDYDGPPEFVERLLIGEDHHGPLIGKKSTTEAKADADQAKDTSASPKGN